MDAECIGPHRLGELLHLERGELRRLHDAQIAEQAHVGRHLADVVGVLRLRPFEHRALAAEAERVAALVCDLRQLAVDAPGLFAPAGHGRDENGGAERLAEDGHPRIQLAHRKVGECVVHQAHAFEERRAGAEAHVGGGAQGDVVVFAPFDGRSHGHRGSPIDLPRKGEGERRLPAPRSAVSRSAFLAEATARASKPAPLANPSLTPRRSAAMCALETRTPTFGIFRKF